MILSPPTSHHMVSGAASIPPGLPSKPSHGETEREGVYRRFGSESRVGAMERRGMHTCMGGSD